LRKTTTRKDERIRLLGTGDPKMSPVQDRIFVERVLETLRRNAGWAVGVAVLLAWFALLYFMFADVL